MRNYGKLYIRKERKERTICVLHVWSVLVSCFWTMILAFFVELYLVGAMMIVMAIAITGVWCISLLRRILALLEQNQNMNDEAGQASEKQSAQAE